jgi:multidrug resistance efflux pump
MKLSNKALFFPALAVGVLVLLLVIGLKSKNTVTQTDEKARLVDVEILTPKMIAPKVFGYGRVEAKQSWDAIAQAAGQIIFRHSDLEKGAILSKGTEIIHIDPTDYQLKLAQSEANLASSEVALQRLTKQKSNLSQTLNIERNRLAISAKELSRMENLLAKKLSSQSNVDQLRQQMLMQQKVVQEVENQLSLLPEEVKVAEAMIEVNQAQVTEAQRALDKTVVVMPETMQISQVNIENNQVVGQQQVMLTAYDINQFTIEAQLSFHDLSLVTARNHNLDSQPQAIRASVRFKQADYSATWPAKVLQVSDSVDAKTGSAAVIVEVDLTTQAASNSVSLSHGMFVEVVLEGQKQAEYVVPQSALHGETLYILKEGRLELVPVEVKYRSDGQVVVAGELVSGSQLVLNDLLPAVAGMMLKIDNTEPKQGSNND